MWENTALKTLDREDSTTTLVACAIVLYDVDWWLNRDVMLHFRSFCVGGGGDSELARIEQCIRIPAEHSRIALAVGNEVVESRSIAADSLMFGVNHVLSLVRTVPWGLRI